MTIAEMHVLFRQFAQQMGMQNVRAILPGQIDLMINSSISDIVNQIIQKHISSTNDGANVKIGQINSLRTLYKSVEETIPFVVAGTNKCTIRIRKKDYDSSHLGATCAIIITDSEDKSHRFSEDFTGSTGSFENKAINFCKRIAESLPTIKYFVRLYTWDDDDDNGNEFTFEEVVITLWENNGQLKSIRHFEGRNGSSDAFSQAEISAPTEFKARNFSFNRSGLIESFLSIPNCLHFVSFDLSYIKVQEGFNKDGECKVDENSFITNYFPIRIIDDNYLSQALNDFHLSPRIYSPLLTYTNDNFKIYLPKPISNLDDYYYVDNKLVPYKIKIGYISEPRKVVYDEVNVGNSVDCNLPNSLHDNVVKHAVELYQLSLTSSMAAAANQAQRNNRTDNNNNQQ